MDINWVKQELPKGAGSDHMLWTLAGYQACHGFEALDANANFESMLRFLMMLRINWGVVRHPHGAR